MRPLPKLNNTSNVSDTIVEMPPSMDRVITQSNPNKRRLIIALAVCLLIGLAAFIYIKYGLQTSSNIAANRVSIGTATQTTFNEFVPVNANLVPESTIYLDTVEGGRITHLHVDDGAIVNAGEPLVTLKNIDLELQVMGREAQYTEQLSNLARAQIAFDQSTLSYNRDLMDAQLEIDLTQASLERRLPNAKISFPQEEVDRLQTELNHQQSTYRLIMDAKLRDSNNAERNLERLRGSVNRMQDSLVLIRESLGELTIVAPINGQVSALNAQVGEVISAGERVGQIDEMGQFKIRALVNEFYLDRLMTGQSAETSITQQDYELVVDKIYPNIENRQFAVDLTFVGASPDHIRLGQNLRLRIQLGDDELVLAIPNGPYYEQTGGLWLFVVSADGKTANRRTVELGRRNPDSIEVLSGLQPNERVLTSSYEGLQSLQQINLTDQ